MASCSYVVEVKTGIGSDHWWAMVALDTSNGMEQQMMWQCRWYQKNICNKKSCAIFPIVSTNNSCTMFNHPDLGWLFISPIGISDMMPAYEHFCHPTMFHKWFFAFLASANSEINNNDTLTSTETTKVVNVCCICWQQLVVHPFAFLGCSSIASYWWVDGGPHMFVFQ